MYQKIVTTLPAFVEYHAFSLQWKVRGDWKWWCCIGQCADVYLLLVEEEYRMRMRGYLGEVEEVTSMGGAGCL